MSNNTIIEVTRVLEAAQLATPDMLVIPGLRTEAGGREFTLAWSGVAESARTYLDADGRLYRIPTHCGSPEIFESDYPTVESRDGLYVGTIPDHVVA